MVLLTGLKVLITGGSRGIGRAAAVMFAKAGADVAVNYSHSRDAAEETAERIRREGREVLLLPADISSLQEVESMISLISKEWDGLDVLVNNAGIWTHGEIGRMSPEVWRKTMAVNLDGVFYVTNAAVPMIKSRGGGSVINVSSTAGVRGEAFHSHYAASKGALIALTKSWAVELAPCNIRVNCVAPGWVDTEMCAEVFKDGEFRSRVEESIPLKRIPDSSDIAGPMLFLASDLSRHITGEIINVNGGAVLCG